MSRPAAATMRQDPAWDDRRALHYVEEFRDARFGKAHTGLVLELKAAW